MHLLYLARETSRRLRFLQAGVLALAGWLAMNLSTQAQDDSGVPPAPPSNEQSADAPPAPDQAPGQGPGDATGPIQDSGVSFQTFYNDLSGQGNWIQTDDYGYVWQPNVNDPNWAPYTDGHWVYTDDGWTWDSSEPYAWAVYHYGRWVNLDGTGWVWVPGYTWAPAWVSWRYGDGYVGWAPLPPDSFAGVDYFGDGYDADFGFHIGGDADDFYGIGPAIYIFLPIGCVGYHDYHHWYHNRNDNFALINHTTNVTNINVARGGPASGNATFTHVTTGGPKVAQIDAASQTPVPRATLTRSSTAGASTLTQGTLAIYAPRIHQADGNARPAQVTSNVGATTINRGTDILHLPIVNTRFSPVAATDTEVAAAHEATGRAPESAKVLTDASSVSPVLQRPLSTMKPAESSVVTISRSYNSTPGAIYNSAGARPVYGPVHMPETVPSEGETPLERAAREAQATPQRIFNPQPTYTPNYNPAGGGSSTTSHTYTHDTPAPAYSPAIAPASRAPEPAQSGGGGYNGGNRGSSGGGGSTSGSGLNNGSSRSH